MSVQKILNENVISNTLKTYLNKVFENLICQFLEICEYVVQCRI